MKHGKSVERYRLRILIPLMVAVLVAGTDGIQNASAQNADRPIGIPGEEFPGIPESPVAPALREFDVPDGMFQTLDEIASERRELINLDYWNRSRASWGFDALRSGLTDKELDELLHNDGLLDLAVFDFEVGFWTEIRDRSTEFAQLHTELAKRDDYLTANVDEPGGTLDVWLKAGHGYEVVTEGLTIHVSEYSRTDVNRFVGDGEWLGPLAELRLSDEQPEALKLTVLLTDLGLEDPVGAELALSQLLKDRLMSLGATLPVTLEVTNEKLSVIDDFCNSRVRCDSPVGGMELGSCSSGFVTQTPGSSQRGLSTAGHCGDAAVNGRSTLEVQTLPIWA